MFNCNKEHSFKSVHLFHVSMSVANRLEEMQRDFFVIGEDFKYHLVDWRLICKPSREVGMGLRKLVIFD